MKTKILVFTFILIICAIIAYNMDRISPGSGKISKDSSSTQILLNMLGELRYTLAAFVWLKADYYHHEYEYNKMDWKRNESLMSLLRLVTILDPHFVQAYDFGGYHLAINLKKPQEAYRFLKEGIANNPGRFELYWELGFILTQEKKYNEALLYLLPALQLVNQTTFMDETALKKLWVVSRIAHCYFELGDWDNAALYCKEWLKMNTRATWPRQKLEIIEKR